MELPLDKNTMQESAREINFFVLAVQFLFILLSPLLLKGGEFALASSCPILNTGDMIKVSGRSAIYVINKDSKLLYFPTGDEFKSWNSNDSYGGYKIVTQECYNSELIDKVPSSLPAGVNFRPGSYIVKRDFSAQLYAVLPGNKLAKISNADAQSLYGLSFVVKTINDVFWPNYTGRSSDIVGKAHEGMLIKKNGLTYYVDSGDVLRQALALAENRFKPAFSHQVPISYLAGFTIGDPISSKFYNIANRAQDSQINATLTPAPISTPTQPQTTQPVATSTVKSPSSSTPAPDDSGYKKSSIGRFILVDIVIDTDSYNPSDSELNEFLRVASNILVLRTNIEFKLGAIRRESYSSFPENCIGCASGGTSLNLFYEIYKDKLEPDYIIFFKADNVSSLNGGYATSYESKRVGFLNNFESAQGQTNRVYVNIAAWKHRFGACGYNSLGQHVSDVAIGGECRNRPGTACILKNDYYQCNDPEMLASFYSRSAHAFTAGTTVHELMHQFGSDGVYNHYGTAGCAVPNSADLNAAQEYAGICPTVFELFKKIGQ